MERGLTLAKKKTIKDAWNLSQRGFEMGFITKFEKKIKKGQKRLQKTFSMENHFGK